MSPPPPPAASWMARRHACAATIVTHPHPPRQVALDLQSTRLDILSDHMARKCNKTRQQSNLPARSL